jgi:uncharacterized UPF0160 family protein
MHIITHKGKAHGDDFISCCIAIEHFDISFIKRTIPTQNDINDLNTMLIDVGRQYDPQYNNFDHHQLTENDCLNLFNHKYICSISLILNHLKIYNKFTKEKLQWLEPKEILDTNGKFKLAEYLNISPNIIDKLQSPIESIIIDLFSEYEDEKTINDDNPLFIVMKQIGAKITQQIKTYVQNKMWIAKNINFLPTEKTTAYFIHRNHSFELNNNLMDDLFLYIDEKNKDIPIFVYPNTRSKEGYSIVRLKDNVNVNFQNNTQELDNVSFTHNTGFMTVTKNNDLDSIKIIIDNSYNMN